MVTYGGDCIDLFFPLPINRQICCKTWCHKLSDLLKIIFCKRLKIVCHFFLFLIKDFCQYVGWNLIYNMFVCLFDDV